MDFKVQYMTLEISRIVIIMQRNYCSLFRLVINIKVKEKYRICACISRTFWQEFTLQNWGAACAWN
jgi:hypothetical protein